MKNKYSMRILVIITIGLISVACKKDATENIIVLRKPIKIEMINNKSQEIIEISYDSNNVEKIDRDGFFRKFDYNGNNPIKEKHFRTGDDIPWAITTYEYDTYDRVTKLRFDQNVNSNDKEWTGEKIDSYYLAAYYQYEYINDTTIKESYFNYSSTTAESYCIIKLDSHKNVKSIIQYDNYSNSYVKTKLFNYKYDDKNHYLKDINLAEYGHIKSKVNNIIAEEIKNYQISYSNLFVPKIVDSIIVIKNYQIEYDLYNFPIIIKSKDETMKIEYQ